MALQRQRPTGFFLLGVFCVLLFGVFPVDVKHLAYNLALSICEQHEEFYKTGEIRPPLKTLPDLKQIKGCAWFDWLSSCDGATGSDGKCDVSFKRKPCDTGPVTDPDPMTLSAASRIVGGSPIEPYKYPSYMRVLNKRFIKRTACGAVILNEHWALTAASCLFLQAGNFSLLAGRYNLSAPEEDEQARKIKKRVQYSSPETDPFEPPEPGSVDLMLLYWQEPLKFSDKVQPATLPTEPYDEGSFWIVGDGATEDGDSGDAKVSIETQVSPISDKACGERVIENRQPVDEWLVCYGDGESKGMCYGDRGTPSYLVEGDVQIVVGVASWVLGFWCTNTSTVSGYTQLYYFRDWIQETIKTRPELDE